MVENNMLFTYGMMNNKVIQIITGTSNTNINLNDFLKKLRTTKKYKKKI